MTKKTVSKEKLLVLVAPLDWGLGHTTRCIPLIKLLHEFSCHIVVACNSSQTALLQPEVPFAEFIYLEGYNIRYSGFRWTLPLRLLQQIPKMLTSIKRENRWLEAQQDNFGFDLILSDNRYGLFSSNVKSVLITHQLNMRSGFGRSFDRIITKLIHSRISRFSECWVPDFAGKNALAGELSAITKTLPIPVVHIGPLSRLVDIGMQVPRVPLTIILSGPEPQRTVLEEMILRQSEQLPEGTFLVRGLPGDSVEIQNSNAAITIVNHLPSPKLNQLISDSNFVMSRSGYTTVMDILKLKKRMIVIPTPGQGEQEYLANTLHKKQIAMSVNQKCLDLRKALDDAAKFQFNIVDENFELYKEVIYNRLRLYFSMQALQSEG